MLCPSDAVMYRRSDDNGVSIPSPLIPCQFLPVTQYIYIEKKKNYINNHTTSQGVFKAVEELMGLVLGRVSRQ